MCVGVGSGGAVSSVTRGWIVEGGSRVRVVLGGSRKGGLVV